MKTSLSNIQAYVTKDGSLVQELMHPDTHNCRNMSYARAVVEAGKSTEMHRHHASEEIYHIVGGKGMMTLGHEQFSIEEGDTICIRPGTAHMVVNIGNNSLIIPM